MKLSIIIPAYNEENTIFQILKVIESVVLIDNVAKEIIIIDDCSVDKTAKVIEDFKKDNPHLEIQYFKQEVNQGKGAAIHKGISKASGDFLIIQDADLEYNPHEYNLLLKLVVDGHADVVYGSRFMGGKPHRMLFFFHSMGNKLLTFISNAFTNLNLSDMETCYKLFRTSIIQGIELKEKRFGFEPEITAKIARIPKIRIYEVGISYYGRTYEEGKKISWKDGFRAIFCMIKYGLLRL